MYYCTANNSLGPQDGRESFFDCVVLTMPAPQILQLLGGFLSEEVRAGLQSVRYSSRFALGVFFDDGGGGEVGDRMCLGQEWEGYSAR